MFYVLQYHSITVYTHTFDLMFFMIPNNLEQVFPFIHDFHLINRRNRVNSTMQYNLDIPIRLYMLFLLKKKDVYIGLRKCSHVERETILLVVSDVPHKSSLFIYTDTIALLSPRSP